MQLAGINVSPDFNMLIKRPPNARSASFIPPNKIPEKPFSGKLMAV